ALRARLRDALADGELAPELALLEPLLSEHPAAEVAAAAIRLARRSAPEPDPGRTGRAAGGRSGAAAAPPPPGEPTWVHLFMTVGSRDDVGPGDVVGAVTGEAGISGEQVGKVDIHQSHTIVEVATEVAGTVIEALNGRTLKGRSLRVDYDRKGAGRKPGGRTPRSGKRPQGGRGAGRGPGGHRS
ncbi:MAG: hypothetical protein GWM90_00740, partial [Gemmatimonadetes bacterium]|nr:hypothetical protein [Gemmatimonadota bacterium]NIQ52065.1 hypothetical protein [Gemmatimonadota bacterium]NIU72165.1 hypothetical protein [Gammaproteobacteria bacterium]NIX42710.1 hypothetical protein [Gemmatimonadota bacterium]NIY06875.1 hypothetical protein [Gemmatimonadota bacterium]